MIRTLLPCSFLAITLLTLLGCQTWQEKWTLPPAEHGEGLAQVNSPAAPTPQPMPPSGEESAPSPAPQPDWRAAHAAIRIRPRDLLTKINLSAKGPASALYQGWKTGVGIPLEQVEELTVVLHDGENGRQVHLRTTENIDPNSVLKACEVSGPAEVVAGAQLYGSRKPGVVVCFVQPREVVLCDRKERFGVGPTEWADRLNSAGRHDVVVWARAIPPAPPRPTCCALGQSRISTSHKVAKENEILGLPAPAGCQWTQLTVDVGETVELAAQLGFMEDTQAVKGAKAVSGYLAMARLLFLQMGAEGQLLEAFPERVSAEERKTLEATTKVIMPLEKALQNCKIQSRDNSVSVSIRAVLPARDLASWLEVAFAEHSGRYNGIEGCGGPGLFFGLARSPNPPTARPATPIISCGPTVVPTPTPLPAPPSPPFCGPAGVPIPVPVPAPPLPPVVPAPPQPQMVTVANVHKEAVTIFQVRNGELIFLQKIGPGEAMDISATTGHQWSAVFSQAPYCANYTVKGQAGEVWLLRPLQQPLVSPLPPGTSLCP